jgi:hypothetical protein
VLAATSAVAAKGMQQKHLYAKVTVCDELLAFHCDVTTRGTVLM